MSEGCSIHGTVGDPDCRECFEVLGKFLRGIDEDLKRQGGGLNVVGTKKIKAGEQLL